MHHYACEVKKDGDRLLYCLRVSYPLLPETVVLRALRNRDVRVNGRRVTRNLALTCHDTVELFTRWQEPELDVLYEDVKLMVLNKPYGISTGPDGSGAPSLLALAEERAAGRYSPRLCHRLDNQTTGLVLLAKSDEVRQAVLQAFSDRLVDREYRCLAVGTPQPAHAVLNAYLKKDAVHARVFVHDVRVSGSFEILTEYRVLAAGEISRLAVRLHTGKTHQIRAHLAHVGHPVLGDAKYGDFAANRLHRAPRLMLCATSVSLRAGGALSYLKGRRFSVAEPF